MSDREQWAQTRTELRSRLKVRIQESITSAAFDGRTVDDPEKAAEYAVNALMEWDEGRDLIQEIAAHLEGRDEP